MKINNKILGLFLMSLAYALAMFNRTSFAEMASLIRAQTGCDEACLSMVASAFFWCYLVMQVPAGLLVDAAGPRRVGAIGCASMGIGAALFASADSVLGLGVARGIMAVGAVSVFLSLIAYSGKTFGRHATSKMGVGLFIGNVGGILAGLPLAYALTYVDWHAMGWVMAALGLTVAAGLWFLAPVDESNESVAKALSHGLPSLARSLKHSDAWLGLGAVAGLAGSFHAFAGFGARQLAGSMSLDLSDEGLLVSGLMAGFAIGAWVWGQIGDRASARRLNIRVASSLACCAWLLVWLSPPQGRVALTLTLFLVGLICASFSNVYGLLDGLAPADAKMGVKAFANCGTALGAALVQLAEGQLPESMAAMPCLVLALVGAACCFELARRCRKHHDTTQSTTLEAATA